MRALVTGAGGFLGSQVVCALLERGHQVRAVLRPASGEPPASWIGKAQIVRGDLRSPREAEKWFEGVDVLVHLAARVRGSAEAQFYGTVVGTEKMLEAMKRAGLTRHVVLASSFSVYDWTAAKRSLNEETPVESKPYERDGYAIAKIWQERIVRQACQENGWTLTTLRPGFIYGPGGPEISWAGFKVGPVRLVVAPSSRLPLTHVDNCAQAFADASEKGVEGTFNVVDDEIVTARQYASRLFEKTPPLRQVPFPYVLGLVLAYTAQLVSRLLFPPKGGKLPGFLIPRRYRARFRPLLFENRRVKEALGWSSKPRFSAGCAVL